MNIQGCNEWALTSRYRFYSISQMLMATLFIEEPLQKVDTEDTPWSLKDKVLALENWYHITGIKYALDESLADTL